MTITIRGTILEYKYGRRPASIDLSVSEALDLYNGGLYELLQAELSAIGRKIEQNNQEKKELTALVKRLEQAGIKPIRKEK